jgi:hypothetical protein
MSPDPTFSFDPPGEGWGSIGGSLDPGASLAAVSWGVGRFDLFGFAGNAVWQKVWNQSDWNPIGQGWEFLGGAFKPSSPLAAVS